jgi:CRISPR-associated protein Cas2
VITLLLSRTPPRLAGFITRWMVEVQEGVYVGQATAKVRRELWDRVVAGLGRGRALMVWDSRNSQGLEFAVHNHEWQAQDLDGLTLVNKPTTDEMRHSRALQEFTDMTPAEINKAMRAWMRKHHPNAAPRRTAPKPALD